jgi:hypothetical protein
MNNRTHNIILRLIKNERRKRNSYASTFNRVPHGFSDQAISQMREILKAKKLDYGINLTITKLIDEFERTKKL